MPRIFLVAALLASAAPLGRAQDPPVFAIDVDVVYVTATVRTEKGELVSDLTADDFTLYEDGRPQKVTLFAPAAQPGQDEALALNLGMLLDTSESMKEQIKVSQDDA